MVQIHSCDNLAGLTPHYGTHEIDTVNKVEGTGSVKHIGMEKWWGDELLTFAEPVDFSLTPHFKIRLNHESGNKIYRIRLIDAYGNSQYWDSYLSALNVWEEIDLDMESPPSGYGATGLPVDLSRVTTIVIYANSPYTVWNMDDIRVEPTATITGNVADATTGLPIAGATVEAGGYFTETDVNGNYLLTVPLTVLEVKASAVGYATKIETVDVSAGDMFTLNFALEPIPKYRLIVESSPIDGVPFTLEVV